MKDLVETLQHAVGDLALAHDHRVGSQVGQMLDLGIGMGAGDDEQTAVHLLGAFHDIARLERIGDGHDEASGTRDIGKR